MVYTEKARNFRQRVFHFPKCNDSLLISKASPDNYFFVNFPFLPKNSYSNPSPAIHVMHHWRVFREYSKYSTQYVTQTREKLMYLVEYYFKYSRRTLKWCITLTCIQNPFIRHPRASEVHSSSSSSVPVSVFHKTKNWRQ